MQSLYFLIPTLVVILVSFLVVRAGAIALMMTGMDRDRAGFQALSAFSGTGFTTKEAELVVNNPIRRRIVSWLIILGNAGVVTVIVTATSSLVTSKRATLPINFLIFMLGIYVIYKIATRKGIMRRWEHFIEKRLAKYSAFEEAVTEDLLHLIEGYGLIRIIVKSDSPLIDTSLAESKLTKKGMVVLGIERGAKWISVPGANEIIKKGDRLVVYGALNIWKNLLEEYEKT